MAGPVTVQCPVCRVSFPVPSEVVGVDEVANTVLVRMDRSGLYGHVRECAAKAGDASGQALNQLMGGTPAKRGLVARLSDADLRGRIGQVLVILERDGTLTTGNRACTMCGATNAECLVGLNVHTGLWAKRRRLKGKPCCASCGVGNTHPSGRDRGTCAEWASEHGAKD